MIAHPKKNDYLPAFEKEMQRHLNIGTLIDNFYWGSYVNLRHSNAELSFVVIVARTWPII